MKNISSELPPIFKGKSFELFSDIDNLRVQANDEMVWLHTGHIMPRRNVRIREIETNRWLSDLYERKKQSFINEVKGNFVLIQSEKNGFRIFSDRFGIKKFFYWKQDRNFIISDELSIILHHVKTVPSAISMAIYAITYHFTGGMTLFKDIFHNEPGQVISFDGLNLKFDKYWDPTTLLSIKKRKTSIEEIADELTDTIQADLRYSGKERLSLSLTGGADTRNLLALFLKLNISPHLYTYGNPRSVDCVKASDIAKGLKLKHCIHDCQFNADLLVSYTKKIMRSSGGLCSLHRAHRLMAVEKENEFADYMFLGTLGGEFIKGVNEDDYIIPSVVYNNWDKPFSDKSIAEPYFKNRFLANSNVLKEEIFTFLKNEPYLNGSITKRKFNALTYITAHLHDAQDINIFSTIMKDIYTPFLDIDYLELLFSSKYTFDQKMRIGNKYLERIDNPVYGSRFIRSTYKPLTRFLYSGEHKPSDVIFNKYYAAVAKVIRQRMTYKHPPNFLLGGFMENFVKQQLPICNDYQVLTQTFKISELIDSFNKENHIPKESYWLKYTNPIMMRFIIEEFNSLNR